MEMTAFNIHIRKYLHICPVKRRVTVFGFSMLYSDSWMGSTSNVFDGAPQFCCKGMPTKMNQIRECIYHQTNNKKGTKKKTTYRHLLNVECSCVHEITICQFPYCRCEFIVFSLFVRYRWQYWCGPRLHGKYSLPAIHPTGNRIHRRILSANNGEIHPQLFMYWILSKP